MATDGIADGSQPILLELKNESGSTVFHMVAPAGMSLPPLNEMLQGGNMVGLQAALLQAIQAQSGQLLQPVQIQAVEAVSMAPTPTAPPVMALSSAPVTPGGAQTLRTMGTHERTKLVSMQEKVSDVTYMANPVNSQTVPEEVSPLHQAAGALINIPLTPRNEGLMPRQATSMPRSVEDQPSRLTSQPSLLTLLSNSLVNQNTNMIDISSQLLGESAVEDQNTSSVYSLPRAVPGKDFQLQSSMDFDPASSSISSSPLLGSQSFIQTVASPKTSSMDLVATVNSGLMASLSQTQQSALAAPQGFLRVRPQSAVSSHTAAMNTNVIYTSGHRLSGPMVHANSPVPLVRPSEPSLEQLTLIRHPVGQGVNLASSGVVPSTVQQQSPMIASKLGVANAQQLRVAPVNQIANQLNNFELQRFSVPTEIPAPVVTGTQNVMTQGPLRVINVSRANSSGLGENPSVHFLMGGGSPSENLMSSNQGLATNAGLVLSMVNNTVTPASSVYSLSNQPAMATTTTTTSLRTGQHGLPAVVRSTQPRAAPPVAAQVVMPAPQTQVELQLRQNELQEQLRVKLSQLQSLQLQQQLLFQQPFDASQLLGQRVKLEGSSATMVTGVPTQPMNSDAVKAKLHHQVEQQLFPSQIQGMDGSQLSQHTVPVQQQQQTGLFSDPTRATESRPVHIQRLSTTPATKTTPLSDIAHLIGAASSTPTNSSLNNLFPHTTSASVAPPQYAAAKPLTSLPAGFLFPSNFSTTQAPATHQASSPPAAQPSVIQILPVPTSGMNPSMAGDKQEKVITIEMVMPGNGPAADLPLHVSDLQAGSRIEEEAPAEEQMESSVDGQHPLVFNDRKLWCEDCHEAVQSICWCHGALARVRDRIIPCRAKLTAPHHISIKTLELRAGGNHIMGAFAKKVIQKRTEFGPFEGCLIDKWPHKGQGLFAVKLIDEDGKSQYFNSADQDTGNWLIYVRPARSVKEQNMVAYQYRGKIYFASIRAIPPNAELKVWYAESYARALDVPLLSEVAKPGSLIDVELRDQVSMDVMEKPEQNPGSPGHSGDDEDHGDQLVINDEETVVPLEASEVEAMLPPEDAKTEDLPGAPDQLLVEMSVVPAESQTTEDNLVPQSGWTCVACSAMFLTPQGLDAHECMNETDTGRRTRSKRKGHPVKIASPAKKPAGEAPLKRKRGRPRKNPLPAETEPAPNLPPELHVLPLENDTYDDTPIPTEADQSVTMMTDHLTPVAAELPPAEPIPDSVTPVQDGALEETKVDRKRKERKVTRKKLRQPKSLFTCPTCYKAFSTDSKLKIHSYTHTGERPFYCTYPGCDKTFTSKFKLLRHELIHTGEKSFSCPYCERNFTRKDHLKNHLKIHDPNKVMFQCDQCQKEYASPFAFKTHMAFHAMEQGEMLCLVCKKEYTDKNALMKHLKVHAGARSVKEASEKNQLCPLCNKRFFTRKDVKRHLVVHTKDRDFLCQFCPMRFGRRDHLIRHLKKAHTSDASNLSLVCDNDMSSLINERMGEEEVGQSHVVSLLRSVAQGMLDPLSSSQPSLKEEPALNTLSLNLPPGLTVALPNTSVSSTIANLPSSFLNYSVTQTNSNSASPRQYTPQNYPSDPTQPINGTIQVLAGNLVPSSYLPIASEAASTPNHVAPTLGTSQAQLSAMPLLKSVPANAVAKPDASVNNSQMVINYSVKNILDAYSAVSTATSMAASSSLTSNHT